MAHHIDENGRLNIDLFTISPDYKELSKDDRMEVLRLIKDWLDVEVIKIQFEDDENV
jgi:hypothetical protein